MRHTWYTEVRDGRVTLRSELTTKIRIIEQPYRKWTVSQFTQLPRNRFGIWLLVDTVDSLAEALQVADGLDERTANPYGICNSWWHIEVHGFHSTCSSCGRKHFDDELRRIYGRKGSVQIPLTLDGGPPSGVSTTGAIIP